MGRRSSRRRGQVRRSVAVIRGHESAVRDSSSDGQGGSRLWGSNLLLMRDSSASSVVSLRDRVRSDRSAASEHHICSTTQHCIDAAVAVRVAANSNSLLNVDAKANIDVALLNSRLQFFAHSFDPVRSAVLLQVDAVELARHSDLDKDFNSGDEVFEESFTSQGVFLTDAQLDGGILKHRIGVH